MCEQIFGHRQQLLSLGFQAELFFQGEGGQENTNAGPVFESNRLYIRIIMMLLVISTSVINNLGYFENRQMYVKWHGKISTKRNMPG